MRMLNTLFAVRDLKKSLAFYQKVLGLEVVNDFGTNVVLTGGLALQTLDSWGQRAVRPYDPDRHMIGAGESMGKAAKRFRDSGLHEEGTARRMGAGLTYTRELLKQA